MRRANTRYGQTILRERNKSDPGAMIARLRGSSEVPEIDHAARQAAREQAVTLAQAI
jgi:hypothetical protein